MLRDKAFNIAKNPKFDEYQNGLASMVYMFFDKKTAGGCVKNEAIQNKELAEELHKPITKKLKKEKNESPKLRAICALMPYMLSCPKCFLS